MIWVVWVGQSLRKISKVILIFQVNEVLTGRLSFQRVLIFLILSASQEFKESGKTFESVKHISTETSVIFS